MPKYGIAGQVGRYNSDCFVSVGVRCMGNLVAYAHARLAESFCNSEGESVHHTDYHH